MTLGIELFLRLYIVTIPNTEPFRAALVYGQGGSKVVAGDSQIYRGFLTATGVVNLGRGGSGIDELEPMLSRYFELHGPGQLVLGVGPQAFSSSTQQRKLPAGSYQQGSLPRIAYLFEPAVASNLKQIARKFNVLEGLESLEETRRENEAHRTENEMWSAVSADERLARTRTRVINQQPEWNARSFEAAAAYERLVDSLTERHVSVCLLRPPVTSEYVELTAADAHYIRSEETFRAIAARFGARYVDFRELDIEWTAEKFSNQDHIHPGYSQIFSDQVWRKCFSAG